MQDERIYNIVKSEKLTLGAPAEIAVETVVGWNAANSRRTSLQRKEDDDHPERSSWTRTLFIIQLVVEGSCN